MLSESRIAGSCVLGIIASGVLMLVVGIVTGSAGGYVVAATLLLAGGALLRGSES
jgi:hypothetical protein